MSRPQTKQSTHSSSASNCFSSCTLTVVGGGGRSSMGRVSSGGVGGVLSNSAIGAILSEAGIGDTELLSIIRGIFATLFTPHQEQLMSAYVLIHSQFNARINTNNALFIQHTPRTNIYTIYTYTPRTWLSHVCVYLNAAAVTNSEKVSSVLRRFCAVPLPAFLREQLDHHIGKNDALCGANVGGKTVWLAALWC